jgi:ABC-type branched-subunit amino acid transport system substrate-binding protein
MRRSRSAVRRVATGVAVLGIVASACSGNRQASDVAAGGPSAAPSASTAPEASAAPDAKATTPSRSVATVGAGVPATGPSVSGTEQKTEHGFTYKAADIFPANQDRVGISSSQITLCMHAPIVLAPAFKDSEKDWRVWWQQLNDQGGIYRRKVNMVFTDDAYTPTGGVQAAQQCYSNNPEPFFMMAGVGFDTVPAVRQWAEQNHRLYLHSFATEKGLYSAKYSFEYSPSVEHFGQVAGNYIAKKWPAGVDGVVWRNSPNWQGGRDTFKRTVEATGAKVVDLPVSQNQGNYTNEILALQRAHAKTVLAWINVLEFAQLEAQAAQQGFFPRWITASFNLVTDTIGDDINGSKGPAAIGLWVTPEYHNGDTTSPWAGEEKAMRAAYAKYDSGHTIVDTDWQAWLAFKSITKFLLDCGRDCTRNKVAGMMLSGYQQQQPPLCAFDFKRGRGRLGSFQFNVMHVVKRGGGNGWQQDATCRETF